MHPHGRRFFALALGVAALTAACKKDAPPPQDQAAAPGAAAPAFTVSAVELGSRVGPDKRVTAATTSFTPRDTIYVSVATEGSAPSTTLSARWTYEDGQVVQADSQTIAPTGPATTEFHIAKPSGWPAGKYKVEVAVDGRPVETRDFEVKR
ncbi:MAG TPA: hypothetical protein VFZ26_16250 [Gemmatimonadales bacterium]